MTSRYVTRPVNDIDGTCDVLAGQYVGFVYGSETAMTQEDGTCALRASPGELHH